MSLSPYNSLGQEQLYKTNNLFCKNKRLERKWKSIVLAVIFTKKIKKRVKKSRYRMNILREWARTEQSYKADLTVALRKIRDPLQQKNLINIEQAKIICSDFEAMTHLSKFMLQILQKNMVEKPQKISRIFPNQSKIDLSPQDGVLQMNPNRILIGDQLCKIAEGYKVYGSFFGNHSRCQKLLNKLSQDHNEQMKQIEKQLQDYLRGVDIKKQNMTIKDCLQQPLYRLFKYVLLMKQYIKRLPSSHPDYKAIYKAHQIFQQINHQNNDLMRFLEGQQKKVKLQKLLGRTFQGSMTYVAEMQADTIEFRVKVYIFNTFIMLSKNEEGILAKEQKYMNLQLDDFSFIALQDDMKYFKNILALTGKHASVHLLFSDPGSKMQLYNCVNKVIKELRLKSIQKRLLVGNQKAADKKIKFTLQDDINQPKCCNPGFRIQVLTPEVRPLSQVTNQTVYITRFMLPQYVDDWKNFIKDKRKTFSNNQHQRLSLGQHGKIDPQLQNYLQMPKGTVWLSYTIDLHLSELQILQKYVKSKHPTINLISLNPLTKDLNIYSDGRKKTRAYQARCFFIEQYLNVIFRHPEIMKEPLQILQKLKVEEQLWKYAIDRNEKTFFCKDLIHQTFDMKHCDTCSKAKIDSLEELEHYRKYFRRIYSPQPFQPPIQKYCLNFYNVCRIKMLTQFPTICFNSLQRVLINIHYSQGRIDYPFLKRDRKEKYRVKIYLPGVQLKNIQINIAEKTTAGEVIEKIAYSKNIDSLFDFALHLQYYDRERVISWDQCLMDIIKHLKITTEKLEQQSKSKLLIEKGLFATIKQWGRDILTQSDGRITLKKHVFLTKDLEMRSLVHFSQKYSLFIDQIFHQIRRFQIVLSYEDLGIIAGLYYVIKQRNNLHKLTTKKSFNESVLKGILPISYYQQLDQNSKLFENHKNRLTGKNRDDLIPFYHKIVNLVIQNESFVTYYVPVQIHTIEGYTFNKSSSIHPYIGVNFKQIILVQSISSGQAIFRLPINQTKCSVSVYSIFLSFQNKNYRLDGKMFSAFQQLVNKYQLIRKKFAQYSA